MTKSRLASAINLGICFTAEPKGTSDFSQGREVKDSASPTGYRGHRRGLRSRDFKRLFIARPLTSASRKIAANAGAASGGGQLC
jgi:hypothetical protein